MSEKEKTDDIQKEVVEEKIACDHEDADATPGTPKGVPKNSVEVWDVADLVSTCGQCGEVTKIATYEGGTQWIMTTRSDSVLSIRCPKCENQMTLIFQNGKKFTEEEKKQKSEIDVLKEESKPIQDKLKSNESQEKSSE